MRKRPAATLSLDLDNEWSYLKTRGDPQWESLPSYLSVVVPRALQILESLELRSTFFVVGQDAELPIHHGVLRSIVDAGHEIGNHSFHHEPWLQLYSEEQIRQELERAETAIEGATGRRPVGFRGPGYSHSPALLKRLVEMGYLYDASTFPTFLGPLARMYYFFTTNLNQEARKLRGGLFGSWKDVLRPIKPYGWRIGNKMLIEVPVTTMPLIRLPMHLSYIIYLAWFSPKVSILYFRLGLFLCRLLHVPPSILIHPLDFLTEQDVPSLKFFPGMAMPLEQKLNVVRRVLSILALQFEVQPLCEFCRIYEPKRRTDIV